MQLSDGNSSTAAAAAAKKASLAGMFCGRDVYFTRVLQRG